MDKLAELECFVNLKDHKDNFRDKPTVRLLNPNKSNIGKVSKIKLEVINSTLREKTGVKQWQSTNNSR